MGGGNGAGTLWANIDRGNEERLRATGFGHHDKGCCQRWHAWRTPKLTLVCFLCAVEYPRAMAMDAVQNIPMVTALAPRFALLVSMAKQSDGTCPG